MSRRIARPLALGAVLALAAVSPLFAQPTSTAPAAPTPAVTGNVSLGLGVTAGNKDTSNLNAGYEFKYDPKTKNVVKSTGLFLYGKTDGDLTTEQYGLSARDEYSLTPRAFVFGEGKYLHDRFKGIESLFAPTAGAGYKLMDSQATQLSVSAGLGGIWEKDYGLDSRSSGAVSFDEKLTQKLSESSSVGQSFSALWNIGDFGDALYLFGANLTATVVGRAALKLELLDTYKVRPPQPDLQSNDVSFITSIVYKF